MMALCDTETTDLTKPTFAPIEDQPRIIEVAVIIVDDSGNVVQEYNELVHPGFDVKAETTKITGITNEMLVGKLPFKDHVPALKEKFAFATRAAGHNLTFDFNMLRFELKRASCEDFPFPKEVFDTVHEYFHLFGYRPKLNQLYQKIMGVEKPLAHRAMADVLMLLEILKHEGWFNGEEKREA